MEEAPKQHKIDLDKEFVYQQYKYLHKENSPVYGVESSEDVRIRSLAFDELCYLLSVGGTHLILFGGPWCRNTAGVIDYINFYAGKYGVDTVYQFDFRMDGESRETSIREDLTAQPDYEGADKAEESVIGANYNYIYGELVNSFLTNLSDWVSDPAKIVYLNRYEEQVSAPRLQVPFLFLYNKDNTIDHSGAVRGTDYVNQSGKYPIISAIEKMYFRDETDGKLYSDADKHDDTTLVLDYGEQLESAIFRYISGDNLTITPYSRADYIRDAYRQNKRGHAYKTQNAFTDNEPINIQMVNYSELKWILGQKGTYMILFGGAWCANTQAAVSTINDYAVANDVTVYMFDTRLDGKYPIDFWKYPRWRELQIRSDKHPLKHLYIDLIEQYLPNISTILDFNGHDSSIISYTDEEGNVHQVGRLQAPHLLCYDSENIDDRGTRRPVLAYCERMYELINCKETFIYSEPNYRDYCAGTYRVFYTYMKRLGQTVKDISVDKTAPIVPGEPIRNPEVPDHPVREYGSATVGAPLRGTAPAESYGDCC